MKVYGYCQFISLMVILFLSLSIHAQVSSLTNWGFSQDLSLSERSLDDSRLNAIFLDDNMILAMQPNLDNGNGCGSAVLMVAGSNGAFNQVQTLSAARDFGIPCSGRDAFGFSADYMDGLLVIGAPGRVFVNPQEQPSDGNVFLYRLNNAAQPVNFRLTASEQISGTGEDANLAWGTRVRTDGSRILVQGNQGRDEAIAQDRVIARTVNLLENNTGSGWSVAQQFTGQETIYGQDFIFKDQKILINRHDFVRFGAGSINVFATNTYRSGLEVYEPDAASGEMEFRQSVDYSTIVFTGPERNDNIQDLDQLYGLREAVAVFAPRGGGFNGISEITWFEADSDGLFQRTNILELERHDIRVSNQLAGIDGISIFERDFNFRGTVGTYTSEPDGPQRQLQQLIRDRSNQDLFLVDFFRLNTSNSRFVARITRAGVRRLAVFTARPALDPVITGLWWFGPEFDGQGITMEVLTNNRLLLHWFTYDLSGNQMWMRGLGQLRNGTVSMQLTRARGPRFAISQFNSADRVVEAWGNIQITFEDCRNGELNYQSTEFGDGTLPLLALVDNGALCNRGFIVDADNNGLARRFKINRRGLPPSIIGSLFDPSRLGEGLIFMPAQVANNDSDSQNIAGLWLTYNRQGDQAWYYLGVFENCLADNCRWLPIEQPRRPQGPAFGPNYDPDDRVITPWGEFRQLTLTRMSGIGIDGIVEELSVRFNNPDGAGRLVLEKLDDPVGY